MKHEKYSQNIYVYQLKYLNEWNFKACLCPLFFIKFLFFHQMIALDKLWKMFFISSKKLISFSRYSNFCIFFPSFPHFLDSKGQMEVE